MKKDWRNALLSPARLIQLSSDVLFQLLSLPCLLELHVEHALLLRVKVQTGCQKQNLMFPSISELSFGHKSELGLSFTYFYISFLCRKDNQKTV